MNESQDQNMGSAQAMPAPAGFQQAGLQTGDTQPVYQQTAQPEPLQAALAPQQPAAVDAGVTADAPDVAADNDVIEREWVVKAKQIVQQTKQDPYRQVEEMNKLRSTYMKKRYDRDIKLAEG